MYKVFTRISLVTTSQLFVFSLLNNGTVVARTEVRQTLTTETGADQFLTMPEA